jgi:uncharacterized membrane protein YdjX (TVP38/TMEM64 family)
MDWLRNARPAPFFAVIALLPAVGVPLTPLFILAGATFGVRLGLVGTWLALAANLALCYWIAQSGLRPRIESLLRRFSYKLPNFKEARRNAVRFTLAVKLMPGPQFAKNYLLGVANVPFALYLTASMLITGLYAAAFVVLGESLLDHNRQRAVMAGGVVVVLALGVWALRRRRAGKRSS